MKIGSGLCLGIVLAVVRHSCGQQTCSTDDVCSQTFGGSCLREAECNLAMWDPEHCGIDDGECGCCHDGTAQVDCVAQDSDCDAKGGSCTSVDECDPDLNTYEPGLCSLSSGQQSDECGCCIPKATRKPTSSPTEPICQADPDHAQKCAAQGGSCMDLGQCSTGNVDTTLCVLSNGQQSDECVCCLPPVDTPKPTISPTKFCVEQDSDCDAKGGSCTSVDECDPDLNTYEPGLCSLSSGQQSDECGCCIPKATRKPTSSPTEPICQADPDHAQKCAAQGGSCMDLGQCSTGNVDTTLCVLSNGQQSDECVCCLPPVDTPKPTSSPTKLCSPQDDQCKEKGGECMRKEECINSANPDNIWEPSLCSLFNNEQSDECGCCIRKDTPKPTSSPTKLCSPQDDQCKEKGGECMRKEECINSANPDNIWEPSLCSLFNNEQSDECGCCIRKDTPKPTSSPTEFCLENDDNCKLKGGDCSKKEECLKSNPLNIWEPSLCSLNNEPSDECGCCIRKETPSPTPEPTECPNTKKCALEFDGTCMDRESCAKLNSDTSPTIWDPDMCSVLTIPTTVQECGCCYNATTSSATQSATATSTVAILSLAMVALAAWF